MAKIKALFVCGLTLCWPLAAGADEIEFAGQITGYFHGSADPGDAQLPAPYTGRFEWNPVLKTASFEMTAPSLDASLLTNPGNEIGAPFVFRDTYNYALRPNDEVTVEASGLMAGLSSGGVNVGFGIIEYFELDASYYDGTGSWTYQQSCPACEFVGLYQVSGTITSIVGVVPEPSSVLLAIASVGLFASPRRFR